MCERVFVSDYSKIKVSKGKMAFISSDLSNHNTSMKMRSVSSKSNRSSSGTVCNNSSKPVILKRRSRASKKTPVTLLKANSSNFRALVQQFTGCPTTPLSLGVPFKGAITLNFQRGIREMQTSLHQHNTSSTTTRPSSHEQKEGQYHHHHHLHNNSSDNNQVVHVRFHQNNQQIESHVSSDNQQIINVDDDNDDDDDCVAMMEKIASNYGDSSSSSVVSASSSSSGGFLEVSHHDLSSSDDFDGFMDDFTLHDLIDMSNALSSDLGYFL